ncbi:hypothetical protein [Streptomyces alkaliterrae]|uniref:Uncharacterized protein n=1 Tax=Streptomyces alkaliterrae TaxID=2213162 RepID=A0A5P0YW50_9ACTN|nr:hypothetical protein [Streptomyces alkaliterrae]MBB1255788.1 hypothetical protein [Streptomyces alkaliterrae]MBB1261843.1 hypothetical protein [Streptomyces alkaliterrae]MQS03827.1 hypothetical protein [Streptomyces alkaliterrae]
MAKPRWQLRKNGRLVGTLTLTEVDMFWSGCHFEPGAAWEELAPLFAASHDAWRRGDEGAALAADEAIHEQGLVLFPDDGGAPMEEFLIRISGEDARFRY